jgi:hypothetical protein
MIAAQLDRLREVDPATWEIYEQEAGCFQFDDQRRGWILQAVLQDACQARGWGLHQEQIPWYKTTYTAYIAVGTQNGDLKEGHGDSPDEALLKCYLVAIG